MANLTSLKKSITQMPYDQALVIIRNCRDSRRVAKVVAKRKTSAKKVSRVIDPFDAVKNMANVMTAEQKEKLRRELMGE